MTAKPVPRDLLPDNATVVDGRLSVGGCDVIDLVTEFGSPLFIYDEAHLVDRCEEAVRAWGPGVAYASKAFLCKAMARLAYGAGMSIDVATGGELFVALESGVEPAAIVMHGNNKSTAELRQAISAGVGRIVVDSFDELDRIEALRVDGDPPAHVLIRVNPGVEAHTHEYLQTGVTDSKFGFPIADGVAARAIERMRASSAVELVGVHAHIGSQVFDLDSFSRAVAALQPFVAAAGVEEFSIGGGLGVAYVEGENESSITQWATVVRDAAVRAGIDIQVAAEPGRAIVAKAAITAYTVGTIKGIPGGRTYVSVDGGMSDNPRPVLYGSGYEAFLARSVDGARPLNARVVGKHCESGDVIVRDASLPADVAVDDILCTPVTGAYGHSMGSNYNKVLRPAVVFVKDGAARLVVQRESFEDLVRLDVG